MDIDILIIVLMVFTAVGIFMLFWHFLTPYFNRSKKENDVNVSLQKSKSSKSSKKSSNKAAIIPKTSGQRCPVCSSILENGQNLISRVFKTGNTDELCHILGCPNCYPVCKPGVKRNCPVCGKNIPNDGHLIARIFHKQEKNDHVHIIGCTQCNKR